MRHALALLAITAAHQPLGIVGNTLGRYDRDTLTPTGPTLEIAEPHAAPALEPGGAQFAVGLSSSGSRDLPGTGRVGVWIVDAQAMTIHREVRTGIAAEAVVFPGVVGALLQNGELVVVDPDNGRIRSRRQIGYSQCSPRPVHVAGHGVIVNEIRRDGVEVAIVAAGGGVRTRFVAVTAPACRQVSVTTSGDRAYIVGRHRVVELDPRTGRTTTHRFGGHAAAAVPGGLAVASNSGVRVYDTSTWRVRWRDAAARRVLAGGNTVLAMRDDVIRARDARTGRLRWRGRGRPWAVVAGRVYAQPTVLDLTTGAQRGTHPRPSSAIRIVEARATSSAGSPSP